LILCALDLDLTTQQTRDLAADRKSETCSTVLAARRSVRLLECLEYEPLLVLGNSDARIRDGKCDHIGRGFESWVLEPPPFLGATHRKCDVSLLGELERVREKVLENLLEPPAIGVERLRNI